MGFSVRVLPSWVGPQARGYDQYYYNLKNWTYVIELKIKGNSSEPPVVRIGELAPPC
jgi:hypothetical protein